MTPRLAQVQRLVQTGHALRPGSCWTGQKRKHRLLEASPASEVPGCSRGEQPCCREMAPWVAHHAANSGCVQSEVTPLTACSIAAGAVANPATLSKGHWRWTELSLLRFRPLRQTKNFRHTAACWPARCEAANPDTNQRLGDSGLAPLTRPTDELTADVAPIRLWPLNTIPRRQFRIPNCCFWNHARWPPESCACGKLR